MDRDLPGSATGCSLLGPVFVVGVEYDGRRLGVRRSNVLAGIRSSNPLTDHLAGELRDRLASVRAAATDRQSSPLSLSPLRQQRFHRTSRQRKRQDRGKG
jgi:hypothetical protein